MPTTNTAAAQDTPGPPSEAPLPLRLHHYAFVVRDQEENRKFFEDVLGLPLVATWCERAHIPDFGREVDYCHTFFGLADGGALAFFQFADEEIYEKVRNVEAEVGRFRHIALKVEPETYDAIEARLEAAGIERRHTDHGYCRSMYTMSPDGLRVEFTVDPDNADEIAAMRKDDAHAELARWLAGDHRINNEDRPH
jgi:catechol 2,3-dioxygenase-like lactoylglutathione lyase family enzyme